MCNDNVEQAATPMAALVPVLDTPFHKTVEVIRDQDLEKFFTASHVGDIAFHTQTGGVHTITIGPFEIDIDLKKVGNNYAIHVVVYFKVGPFKKKIIEFTINLPISDKCVCKTFNVIGIVKATFCFCIENGCIYFTYDIQSVAGNWKGKIKLLCF